MNDPVERTLVKLQATAPAGDAPSPPGADHRTGPEIAPGETMTLRELAAMSTQDGAGQDATITSSAGGAMDHHGAAVSCSDPAILEAEALVLRAGLEDCLCHLVELYGPAMLDGFLTRRINLSIRPLLACAAQSPDAAERETLREQAEAARRLLEQTVQAVRDDPAPPEG